MIVYLNQRNPEIQHNSLDINIPVMFLPMSTSYPGFREDAEKMKKARQAKW